MGKIEKKHKELYSKIVKLTGIQKKEARKILEKFGSFDDVLIAPILVDDSTEIVKYRNFFGKDDFDHSISILSFLAFYRDHYVRVKEDKIDKLSSWIDNSRNIQKLKSIFEYFEEASSFEKKASASRNDTHLRITQDKIEKRKETKIKFEENIEKVKDYYTKNYHYEELDTDILSRVLIELYRNDVLWMQNESKQALNISYIIGLEPKYETRDEVTFNLLCQKYSPEGVAEQIGAAIEISLEDEHPSQHIEEIFSDVRSWVDMPTAEASARLSNKWREAIETDDKEIKDYFKVRQDFVYRGIALESFYGIDFLSSEQLSEIHNLKTGEQVTFTLKERLMLAPKRDVFVSSWTNSREIAEMFTTAAYVIIFTAQTSENPDKFLDLTNYYKSKPTMANEQEVIGVGQIRIKQITVTKERDAAY